MQTNMNTIKNAHVARKQAQGQASVLGKREKTNKPKRVSTKHDWL